MHWYGMRLRLWQAQVALLVLTSASGLRVAPSVVIVQAGQQAICRRPFAGGPYRHLSNTTRLWVAKPMHATRVKQEVALRNLGSLPGFLAGSAKCALYFR